MEWTDLRSRLSSLSSEEQERIKQAYDMGKEAHGDQKRKSGELYFTAHCTEVAAMLADLGADADTIVAALLHDTLEDTDLPEQSIRDTFGEAVTKLVQGVTKLSSDELEKVTHNEQHETLRKMFTLMEEDIRIMVVKLVDRLHNMRTAKFIPEEKQKKLARETKDVYAKIADRLCMLDLRDELEELCLEILEPILYKELLDLRKRNAIRGEHAIKEISDRIATDIHPGVSFHYERKSWEVLKKIHATQGVATGVSSVTLGFDCETEEDCYHTLGILHSHWTRESLSFRDTLHTPLINGYRGLHTTIILEDGMRVRCKIRTPEMLRYSKVGITTRCFDAKAKGLLDYLEWTGRITPLAEDTKNRSKDFWDSLQTDILSDSIIVHSPTDYKGYLPKGATALDAAFYIFNDAALRMQSIYVNGKEVSPQTIMQDAQSIDITTSEASTVERRWLKWVRTGFAGAAIRTALSANSKKSQVATGKILFQDILTKNNRGYLEEFEREYLRSHLRSTGYDSFSELYIALASGHISPDEAYVLLFEKKKQPKKPRKAIVRYLIPSDDTHLAQAIHSVHDRYLSGIKKITYSFARNSKDAYVRIALRLENDKLREMLDELQRSGAEEIETMYIYKRERILIGIVIFLWSLNPVFAKLLLLQGIGFLPLLTIRFLVFSVFSLLLFAAWRVWTREKFTPIKNIFGLAALPTLGNVLMSVFTYASVSLIPPSVHLTILRFNTLFLRAFQVRDRRSIFGSLAAIILLLAGMTGLFFFDVGAIPLLGIGFAVISLGAYMFYSLSTEYVLNNQRIDVRYPYVLFYSGMFLGVIGLGLFFWQQLWQDFDRLTVIAILYVLLCVCIPHMCYQALLRIRKFSKFTDLLLLEVPLAFVFEIAILGIILPPIVYGIIGVILATLLFLRLHHVTRFHEDLAQ